ncbi:MAG: hypothetical protein AVO33_11320 [delta proteobacterium ML8_F1]|nr:MAG: hypothetical protein AVO33_11320 [delta proteobacterium ML8_F1]
MKRLTKYVIATTHLYGLVHKDKVVEIYNSQNEKPIDVRAVEALLEKPTEELEKAFVFPQGEYFVHEVILEFDEFDLLLRQKGNKPHYVPEKNELLKYVDDSYFEKNLAYKTLLRFMTVNFFKEEKEKAEMIVEDIQGQCQFGINPRLVMEDLNRYGVVFDGIDQVNELLSLIMDLSNHTRIWQNNGHTPDEIFEAFEKPNMRPLPQKPFVYDEGSKTAVKEVKVGRNDPCPCGSGKKYKKCCLGKDLQH